MVTKYGLNSNWGPKEVCDSYGTRIKKSILKGDEKFWRFIKFRLGLGEEIGFWEDSYCGDNPLKEDFTSIYNLAIK